jgi:hypothetical protein
MTNGQQSCNCSSHCKKGCSLTALQSLNANHGINKQGEAHTANLNAVFTACRSCPLWCSGIDRHCPCRTHAAQSTGARHYSDSQAVVEEMIQMQQAIYTVRGDVNVSVYKSSRHQEARAGPSCEECTQRGLSSVIAHVWIRSLAGHSLVQTAGCSELPLLSLAAPSSASWDDPDHAHALNRLVPRPMWC